MLLRVECQIKNRMFGIKNFNLNMYDLNRIIKRKRHFISFTKATEESYKLIKQYNGHIIQKLIFEDFLVKFSNKLNMYFKLKDMEIKQMTNELYIYRCLPSKNIKNLSFTYWNTIADAVCDGILTLPEYYMILEEINDNYHNKYKVIFNEIVFDDLEKCNKFIEYLRDVYKIEANIIKTF